MIEIPLGDVLKTNFLPGQRPCVNEGGEGRLNGTHDLPGGVTIRISSGNLSLGSYSGVHPMFVASSENQGVVSQEKMTPLDLNGPETEERLAKGLVAVSLVSVGLVGITVVLLMFAMFRRRGELPSVSSVLEPMFSPSLLGSKPTKNEPDVSTYSLPASSSDAPIHLASGSQTSSSTIEIRVVGPAGAYATLAYDPAALYGGSTSGRVFVVPGGSRQKIKLGAGQSLYGAGSAAGVIVSVAIG